MNLDDFDLGEVAEYYRIRPSSAGSSLQTLMAMDERLVRKGFPPLSPWWVEAFGALYGSGGPPRRRLVARVGRRGGKSSSACRFAVNEAMHGDFNVTPGDIGWMSLLSVKQSESLDRLRMIAAILDAENVPYDARGQEIILRHLPRGFRVYPANFRTVVGGTWIGMIGDEMAKWRDDQTGKNPATEVLRSAKPSMKTMRNAKELYLSSPWSTIDAHHDAFEAGNNNVQAVAWAPTWVANPTISEQDCRDDEPDGDTFEREFGAIPMSSLSTSFFDANAVREAACDYEMPLSAKSGTTIVAGADFAFRSDSSALVVAHITGGTYKVADLLELSPEDGVALVPGQVVGQFAGLLRQHGISGVMADGHYRESIVEHLGEHDLAIFDAPSDVPSTYVRARTLLHSGKVIIPNNHALVRDLIEVQARPTATGRLTMKLPRRPGGGHCDLVSALVLSLWQRHGHEVEHEKILPSGWTQPEIDDVERILQRRQDERELWGFDDGDDGGWFDD